MNTRVRMTLWVVFKMDLMRLWLYWCLGKAGVGADDLAGGVGAVAMRLLYCMYRAVQLSWCWHPPVAGRL